MPNTITSHDVSWWAEAADGTRDKDVSLVKTVAGEYVVKGKVELGEEEVLKIRTDSTQPERPKLKITAKANGSTVNLDIFDSIFLTESAVEKFLWPYYHAHRIYDEDIRELYEGFRDDPSILGIGHVAPSRPFALPRDEVGLVVKVPGVQDEVQVMSLSDYLALV